jgi:LmbE family N-acetylglucosaminyl deacetylase
MIKFTFIKKCFAKDFLILFILLLLIAPSVKSQPERIKDAAELKLALEKLNTLGSVLYIAAHPDDENNALLAYFSSGRLLRTGYLAMNRGGGGQNLVGKDLAQNLGVIRTQELLAARRIDGAEQFFTRAVDFGYSKSAGETFEIWGKQKILSDVVFVIRKFRPDVIITRFPGTGAGGHGHHTASAILAMEAFKISADTNVFPEQFKYVKPWQAKRIYWNAWNPSLMKTDHDSVISVDLGGYNPLLGKSYTEIAAEARSMHKTQGFGSSARRGETINYFTYLDGIPAKRNLFEDVDLTWDRVPGSGKVKELLSSANKNFNPENPSAIIPTLVEAYKEMGKIKDSYWITVKRKELLNVIRSAAGIWMEAIASDYSTVPGGELNVTSGIVNRSDYPFILKNIKVEYGENNPELNKKLNDEDFQTYETTVKLPDNIPITQPYWLRKEPTKGDYIIDSLNLVGKAENDPPVAADFILDANGVDLPFEVPVLYRWTDPVKGEKYRSIVIAPPVTINFDDPVYLFPDNEGRRINISLKSHEDNANGTLKFNLPSGWKIEPEQIDFTIKKKNDEKFYTFTVYPPAGQSDVKLIAEATIGNKTYSKSLVTIDYSYIPIQTLFPPAEIKMVKLNINKVISNIGYIMGSGDDIPFYLEQLGYKVTLLNDDDIDDSDLSKYDAIVAGIRAYNTRDKLAVEQSRLMQYVQNGGTFGVQYVVNRRTVLDQIGPYPFNLSRDRVTVEEAPVTFINPDNQLLNFPNKITQQDFQGWVQERGLYFADTWNPKYETVIECNDPGEKPLKGGLLFAHFGKGAFIYTGYSWFRQLPAGVPGSYRIFVNLISAGKKIESNQQSSK